MLACLGEERVSNREAINILLPYVVCTGKYRWNKPGLRSNQWPKKKKKKLAENMLYSLRRFQDTIHAQSGQFEPANA